MGAWGDSGSDPVVWVGYSCENGFLLLAFARWSYLHAIVIQPEIGKDIDIAMDVIE